MVIKFGFSERYVNPLWAETCTVFQVMPHVMEKVATRLKNLRKLAVPRLTVRAIAEALDMPLGSYARYESVHDYKKPFLPLELARKIAVVLGDHSVDPTEVMKLAGLNDTEAAPEGRQIEAQRPQPLIVQMSVVLPNEAVLAQMFDTLLSLLPADTPRPEIAKFLAQRLGSGFAGLGSLMPAAGSVAWTEGEAAPPAPAKDHPAPEQQSHI